MEERLENLESLAKSLEVATIKIETTLETNVRSLAKINESLEKLTDLQIDRAADKAEICAKIDECDRRISSAHVRLDKSDEKTFRIWLMLIGSLLTAFIALASAIHT